MRPGKILLYVLGAITLVGFGLLGTFLALGLQGREPDEFLRLGGWENDRAWPRQVADGLGYGAIASINILWLLYNRLLDAPRSVFAGLIRRYRIGLPEILVLSACAGVGEEILFRGALQHWLGIWWTSLVFIALHGYLDPRDWRISLYGLFMIVIVAGLGYLYDRSGLLAAILAHALIDISIFMSLRYFPDLRNRS